VAGGIESGKRGGREAGLPGGREGGREGRWMGGRKGLWRHQRRKAAGRPYSVLPPSHPPSLPTPFL